MDPVRQPGRPVAPGRKDPCRLGAIVVRFAEYSFGSVGVDGVTDDHDLIIDRGKIRNRTKAASKRFRDVITSQVPVACWAVRRGHWPLNAHRLRHADQVDLVRRDHQDACT